MRPLRYFLFLPRCGAGSHAGACCKGVAVGHDGDRCNAIRGVCGHGDIGAAIHYTSVRRRVDRDAGAETVVGAGVVTDTLDDWAEVLPAAS